MKRVVIFLILLLPLAGIGQNKTPYFLTFSSKTGIMVAHRAFMSHLIRNKTYSFELSLSKQVADNSIASTHFKLPLNGLTLEYRNFGYDEVLGKAISIIQYQNFVIFQTKNNLCLDFKVGNGFGYITKKYDKDTNPTNNAIGSNFNSKASFKIELNKFTKRYHFGIGFEAAHFSNGTIQHPNLGLNAFSIQANVGYNFEERKIYDKEKRKSKCDATKEKGYLVGEGILSISEVLPLPKNAKKYGVFAGRFSFVKPVSSNWNWEIGGSVVYNLSNKYKNFEIEYDYKDVTQLGLYTGMSLNYYKSQIVFGFGYYVLDKIQPLGRFYNRIGYRYYFKENLFGLFNIRANFGKADFFEFGMGYKFNRK